MDASTIVARYYDRVWNDWEVGSLGCFVHEDLEGHASGQPDFGFEGLVAIVEMFHAAFPDWRIVAEETVADGDRVAVRFRSRGTFVGAFLGVPPHGGTVSTSGIVLYRVRDGRITAIHMEWDHRAFAEALLSEPAKPGS
jgi:steroid delta-isomerase-like uncharacterized protein